MRACSQGLWQGRLGAPRGTGGFGGLDTTLTAADSAGFGGHNTLFGLDPGCAGSIVVGQAAREARARKSGLVIEYYVPRSPKIEVDVHATDTGTEEFAVAGNDHFVRVRGTGDIVLAATVTPDSPGVRDALTWEAHAMSVTPAAIGGDKRTARLSSTGTVQSAVRIKIGGTTCWEGTAWMIWTDLEVQITGTIDPGNDASELEAGHQWPPYLGGGNTLGEIDCETTAGLTYDYAVGRIQAKATLEPEGIQDVVPTDRWHMRRVKESIGWDNAGRYIGETWFDEPAHHWTSSDDTSFPEFKDEDPTSGASTREIYDLDAPGSGPTVEGTTVYHTSERYANFDQYVTVTLRGGEIDCSEVRPWSYEGRVDVDKATDKVELNQLRRAYIRLPTSPPSPYYEKR